MEIRTIFEERTFKNQRALMLLLAFLFILLLLGMANARSAYAAGSNPAPQMQNPGGGGGPNPTPDTIYGQLGSLGGPGGPIPADVYVSLTWFTSTAWTYTDGNGVFQFQQGNNGMVPMMPNTQYEIMVNADPWDNWLPNDTWGQWSGNVVTDNTGWALVFPHLQPAAVVNVTQAALYSNTQYATLYYGTESDYQVEHSLSFNVPVAGISTGYTTSLNTMYSLQFWTAPLYSEIIYSPYYAVSFFDATQGKVVSSGIAAPALRYPFGSTSTQEYVTAQNANPAYTRDFTVAPGGGEFEYKESSSWTWQASVVPFGIIFQAWNQVISIDVTVKVTSGWTQWVRAVFTNPTSNTLEFQIYTPGVQPTESGFGGMELHVWDLSGDG
jgi:hypothetical protein